MMNLKYLSIMIINKKNRLEGGRNNKNNKNKIMDFSLWKKSMKKSLGIKMMLTKSNNNKYNKKMLVLNSSTNQ